MLAVDITTSEKLKYQKVWKNKQYRLTSPSEVEVENFVSYLQPGDTIVELGCGTGRASKKISNKGFDVELFDIADNCLDPGISLPLTVGSLWRDEIPKATWGFCCDVMEHIPTELVYKSFDNIRTSCTNGYFRIHLCKDNGKFTDEPLHLTVKPVEWWGEQLKKHWSEVTYKTNDIYAVFICRGLDA